MRAAYLLLLRTISGPGDATARRPRRPGCVVCAGSTPFDRPGAGPGTCAPARPRGTGGGGRVLRRKVRAPCCSRAAGPCARGAESRESETRHAQTLASRDWHIHNIRFIRYIYTGHRPQCSDHRQCSEFSRHTQTGTQIHTLPARRAERVPRVLYNELTKYIVIRHL
jgi:hypothetical protein